MGSLVTVANILGLAVGAGLNLYAAVLVTGLTIRFGWLSHLPGEMDILAHPAVLITAGVLYAAEFIADKVPFFTPIWDGLHTFIRPIGGGLLALSATANMDPMIRILAMLAAGTVALGTHSSKMGVRLMAHTAPEPTSHSLLSVAEDIGVVALLTLVFRYPLVALPVLGVLLLGIALLLPMLLRVARFCLSGLWGRLSALFGAPPAGSVPGWVPEGDRAVRVFSRRAPRAPRWHRGYLVLTEPTPRFVFRRWWRTRSIDLPAPAAAPEWGLFYNVIRCGSEASFYVTKEWCPLVTKPRADAQTPGGAAFQSADCR